MKKPRKSPKRHAVRATPTATTRFAPVPTRRRHDGWTPERQLDFLEALAASACVAEACAAVNISSQSAYRLRNRIDAQAFRIAWDAALDLGIRRLTDACLSRALHGEAVPHFYQGEQIGEHRRYDNRLAMFLLRYRDPLRYAASLDQMVYSGQPERTAIAFSRACDAAADAAYGVDPDPAAADAPGADATPWQRVTIDQALADARERAIVEGGEPIVGSHERRTRLNALRTRYRATQPDDPDPDEDLREATRRFEAWEASRAQDRAAGGDVPSPSSPSASGHEPPPPPPDTGRPPGSGSEGSSRPDPRWSVSIV